MKFLSFATLLSIVCHQPALPSMPRLLKSLSCGCLRVCLCGFRCGHRLGDVILLGKDPWAASASGAPAAGEAAMLVFEGGGAGGQDPSEPFADAFAGLTPAQVNEQHRKKALAWLHSEPFPRMLIARNLLVPLQRMQRRYISIGSPKWESHQAATQAAAGGNVGDPFARTYPLEIAAECGIEEEALASIRMLFLQQGVWGLMPQHTCRADIIGLAFRMCSRAGGLIHRELQFLHERFPFKLFLVLKSPESPGLAKQLKQEKPCSRCPFTEEFMAKHDLEKPETRFMLLLIAKLVRMTIADVECTHAALRRLLMRVQAKHMDLEAAGTQWVAQRYRRRGADLECLGAGAPGPTTTEGSADQHPNQKDPEDQKVRAPGMWRTSVALESSGKCGKPDLAALALKYKEMSDEDLEHCRPIASAAARARKSGDKSRSITLRARGDTGGAAAEGFDPDGPSPQRHRGP